MNKPFSHHFGRLLITSSTDPNTKVLNITNEISPFIESPFIFSSPDILLQDSLKFPHGLFDFFHGFASNNYYPSC